VISSGLDVEFSGNAGKSTGEVFASKG
jgi:hypothetical protein